MGKSSLGLGGIGMEEVRVGHRTGQVKWNSGAFGSHLERSGSRYAMGGAHIVQAGRCQFWIHVGLFGVGASLFREILLRCALGREPANLGLTSGSPTT